MFISKLSDLTKHYDPYGELRVFAFQGLYLITSLFLINLFFGPYKFQSAMNIPICAFYVCGLEPHLVKRLTNMALYSLVNISYVVILSIAQVNRFLIVGTVGVMVFSLFMLGKNKLPIILIMVPLISALSFSQVIPYSGDIDVIINYVISYVLASCLGIGIIYLFPRRYFFNIWLNNLVVTIAEFKCALIKISNQDFDFSKVNFNNQYNLQTRSLSIDYKGHNFVIRKLSLTLVNIYSFITILINQVDSEVNKSYIAELIDLCDKLELAISKRHKLDYYVFSSEVEGYLIKVQRDFNLMIVNWNKLCSKI